MICEGDMEQLSESQLVKNAKHGDAESFATLAWRYQKKVYQTIFWMTKDHQDTDDLAQETFLHAYKHLKGFRQKSSFYTWIYRIAVNLTLNFLKKKARQEGRAEISAKNCPESIGGLSDVNTPESRSEKKELGRKLSEALDALPFAYKTSFILVVLQGMTHRQVSQTLGCSENTVSWRMYKARKMLQGKLFSYFKGEK